MKIPVKTTAARIESHTEDWVNERIRMQTKLNIQAASEGGPEAIRRRLEDLDREWDIERYLETGASSLSLLGAALGLTVNRKWLFLPAIVAGFMLQHSLQGWSPPLPVLRRLGVRTADEINQERYALKALRGDFAQIQTNTETTIVADAVGITRH